MTFLVHVAPHPDPLVSLLCAQLATPLDGPFAREVVAVPTRGIERWLTQRIASDLAVLGAGDGICANVDFPSPHRLVRDVLLTVPELAESVTAWQDPGLSAHVISSIDANVGEPWMRLLDRYLATGDPHRSSPRRLSAAKKISRLYSSYARQRPDMIRAWAAGEDLGSDGELLPAGDRWQPMLWRSLRQRLDVPALPELMPAALDPLRAGVVDLDLPERFAVYGLSAIDPMNLQVLRVVAEHRDVHLYVLHPSPALWEIAAQASGAGSGNNLLDARADDDSEEMATHPLLKVWGRDSRELQLVLAGGGLGGLPEDDMPETGGSLLNRLHTDIRANRAIELQPDLAAAVESGADRSVQIHVCHGARRQAEVMRDAVLHVLGADHTLEPRDVVIMTPDLETFAPLLEAAFPSTEARMADGLPDLRLRIADRSPSATNPLVRFTANLLSIADGRLEAGVVRELVARPLVQCRFGLETDTTSELIGLIDDAAIAWGLDGAERESWGAGINDERTWRRGLNRILSGVFYADDQVRVVETTAPMEGIEGDDAAIAGTLANILDRLAAARVLLDDERPMSEWAQVISSSVQLLAAPAWGDEWQLDQLERLLADTFMVPESAADQVDPVITLAEARSVVSSWIDDRPSPLHFRTGDVTVCTLAPMRSVPYRVVCLLGMDEARFPRAGRSDGDDLVLRHEIVGDPSRSTEDRQLLLDAVMAAGQTLIVTYSGRDEMTNAELPPCVPIAELSDALTEMVGNEARKKLTTTHPLQAFSEANFTADQLGVVGPWAFDAVQLGAARAVQARADNASTASQQWTDWERPERVRLEDLVAFLEHPCKRFLKERLGFTVPKPGERADDTLPADLNALHKWSVQDRLLAGLVEGHDLDALAERERASDALPPGDLGRADLAAALDAIDTLWSAALEVGYDPGADRPISGVVAAEGGSLEGTVVADPDQGQIVTVTPSRLGAKHRLRAFAQLAFLSALDPSTPWKAVLIGKRASGDKHVAVTLGPIGMDPTDRKWIADAVITDLVDLYDSGMRVPLPLPCGTAFAWQEGLATSEAAAFGKAATKWETDRFAPEAADRAHQLLLPHAPTLDTLLDVGFREFAARLWDPILAVCEETKL